MANCDNLPTLTDIELLKTNLTNINTFVNGNAAATFTNTNNEVISSMSAIQAITRNDADIIVQQPFTGAATRTQHDKNAQKISVLDAAAVSEASATSAFSIIEASDLSDREQVDLLGKKWTTTFLPINKNYVNGAFVIGGVTIPKKGYLTYDPIGTTHVRSMRKILAIGDSLTELRNGTSYTHYIANALNAAYGGSKEIGYVPFASYSTKPLFGSSITPTWTGFTQMYASDDFGNFGVYPDLHSPDGKGLKLPIAVGGETITLSLGSLSYETAKLAYLATPSGGTYQIKFAGTESIDTQTFSTYSATTQVQYLTLPSRPSEAYQIQLSSFEAGKEFNFFGVDLTNPSRNGFTITDYSRNGIKLTDINDLAKPSLATHLAQLDPTLILLNIGTNDAMLGVSPSVFDSELREYIAVLTANAANAQIVIIEPNDHIYYRDATKPFGEYTVIRRKVAKDLGLIHFDTPLALGNYNEWRDAGWYETVDYLHPNGIAKRHIATALLDYLGVDSVNNSYDYPVAETEYTHVHDIPTTAHTTTTNAGAAKVVYSFGLNRTTRGFFDFDIVVGNSGDAAIKMNVRGVVKKTNALQAGLASTVTDVVSTQLYKTGAVAFSIAVSVAIVANKAVVSITPTGWNINFAVVSGIVTTQTAHPVNSIVATY